MAWFNKDGKEAPTSIQKNENGITTITINPASNAQWREENGYIYDQRPQIGNPSIFQPSEEQILEFETACQQFRDVCSQIGEAIGKSNFKGGFEEMTEFQQSAVFQTDKGMRLAIAWSAINEYCKYTGRRIGYGQPDWWKHCWETVNQDSEETNDQTE